MTCTWEPDFTGIESKWDEVDDEVKPRALMLATSSLQMLTNNRVGTCPITVRPCPEDRACKDVWEPYRLWSEAGTLLNGGNWLNPCGCKTAHWCTPLSEVDLEGPVGYISSIKIDGVEQDVESGDWRLDDGHFLVWQGVGPSPIPATQDLNKPDTKVGTWSITYSKSYPVNLDARIAVAWLALEFAAAFKPKGKCALPRAVQSVTRSGVSFTIEANLFPQGLTGIDVVDQFILKWTPVGSPSRNATVFSPRSMRNRTNRTTSGVPRTPPSPYIPQPNEGFGL